MSAVYLAAPLGEVARARELVSQLENVGYRIVSTWHRGHGSMIDPVDFKKRHQVLSTLKQEIAPLEGTGVLVALMSRGTPRATIGEVVYALEHKVPVLWIHGPSGEGRNIWDADYLVETIADQGDRELAEDVKAALQGMGFPAPEWPKSGKSIDLSAARHATWESRPLRFRGGGDAIVTEDDGEPG